MTSTGKRLPIWYLATAFGIPIYRQVTTLIEEIYEEVRNGKKVIDLLDGDWS